MSELTDEENRIVDKMRHAAPRFKIQINSALICL